MWDLIKWRCKKSADLDLQHIQKEINLGSEGNGLTHLFQIDYPILTSYTSIFLSLGLLDCISYFLSHFNRLLCKQTLVALIRQALVLYGLNDKNVIYRIEKSHFLKNKICI